MKALGKVEEVLARDRSDCWDAEIILFNSVVVATSLYASQSWPLSHGEKLEKIQVNFMKNMSLLSKNSPNHFIIHGPESTKVNYNRKRNGLVEMSGEEHAGRFYDWILGRGVGSNRKFTDCWFACGERTLATAGYPALYPVRPPTKHL